MGIPLGSLNLNNNAAGQYGGAWGSQAQAPVRASAFSGGESGYGFLGGGGNGGYLQNNSSYFPQSIAPISGGGSGGGMGLSQGLGAASQLFSGIMANAGPGVSDKVIGDTALSGAATGASVGSMFGPIGTGVGAIVGGLGGLAVDVMSYFEAKDQEAQARKEQEQQLKMYNDAVAEDTRRYNQEYTLKERTLDSDLKTADVNRQMSREGMKIKKEQMKIDSMMNGLARMTLFMNTPQNRAQSLSVWGGRRSA